MIELCKRFSADERGISAIQYSLVIMICSISIIVGLMGQRDGINSELGTASTGLENGTN